MAHFPPCRRLRTAREFDRVFRRGTRQDGTLFLLVASPNQLRHDRLGLAVSRRVGGAVVRNRVKRLLRESFRRFEPAEREGADLVIVGKPTLAHASYSEVSREFGARRRRLQPTTQAGGTRPARPR